MKKSMIHLLFTAIAFMIAGTLSFGQGTTTAGMNGRVVDDQGNPLPGATVIAVHVPTGSQFGGITDSEGYFRLPNLNVGGPYTITISFVGYKKYEKKDIYLTLGQTYKLNVVLRTSTTELAEVAVKGKRVSYNEFDGNKTGAETVVGVETIDKMPSIAGNLYDYARFTPQANVNGSGISFAGMNNRYNSVMVDGTVNNDVFGLASNGMNGGQTGISPLSIETVEQLQVVLAPYDVRLGGFAGGGINVVTKSGTNKFRGLVYYKHRGEGLAGKTPTDDPNKERVRLPDFSANTYGVNLGGPIIKNKLFFFANVELQKDQTPQPFDPNTYEGNTTVQGLDSIRQYMIEQYQYDPGDFRNNTRELNGKKFFLKLDWNINQKNKLMIRHQYTYGGSVSPSVSNPDNIYFKNAGVFFPSTTNTSAIELKSRFSGTINNNLKVGYTHVFDDRNVMGSKFPGMTIQDGNGKIHLGGEIYSTGNQLKQSILTITDNLDISKGKHLFTFGTHNEFYHIYNLFMRRAYGDYGFPNVASLYNNAPNFYRIGYSLVDDIRGDGSKAAADFKAMQLGFYAQDKINISEDFIVTAGIRVDIPMFKDQPREIPGFNDTTVAKLQQVYDLKGARSGQMPFTQILISPRLGFNWDVNGNQRTQLRGGIGVFTSRVPFVWPAGSYTNNGMVIGDYRSYSPSGFNPDWQTQYVPSKDPSHGAAAGSQVDLYAKKFKLPQMLKANLAVDKKLPHGFIVTIEGIYTKTLNNVLWKDVNVKSPWGQATGTGDNRPLFKTYKNGIESHYGQIMLGGNTNQGYAYNFTGQVKKYFNFGLDASIAWTYGRSKSIFDGTSSQNSSQWNYLVSSPVPRNEAVLGYSTFDMGHRIIASLNYKVNFLKHFTTSVGLVYTGQSGHPINWIYDDYYGSFVNEAYRGPELLYVPKDQNDIHLVDYTSGGTTVSAAQQWAALDNFISSNDYLNTRKGKYAERFADRLPWENILDLRIVQDIYETVGEYKHTLQITFDIFNFGNMINKNWGRRYYVSNYNVPLIHFEGFQPDHTTPEFSYRKPSDYKGWFIDDSGLNSSRWQAQIGFRYLF